MFIELQNLYTENIDKDKLTDYCNQLLASNLIMFYAFIEHNKDLNPDRTAKKSHYHLMIDFNRPDSHDSSTQIIVSNNIIQEIYKLNNIDITKNKNYIRRVKKATCFANYFIHKYDIEKYQYNVDEIITSDKDVLLSLLKQKNQNTEPLNDVLNELIDTCLLAGTITKIELFNYFRAKLLTAYYFSQRKCIYEMLTDLGIRII